ncbi:hypothetical protein [Mesorhizobium sp. M0701]|uniref:hypothetical protein n=1 Tax=Mesorhizobium sp. M0701 TaxID=2956989 RepID=UPI003336046E
MKITNISQGPRGIHTEDGLRIIPVGGTIEADVKDVELKGARATGWFEFGAAKTKEADTEREDLKKQAGELGIEYAKNIPTDKLKELVDAKLAE